jgi:hypothetical protein
MSYTSSRRAFVAALAVLIASCAAPVTAQQKVGLRYDEIPRSALAIVAEVRAKPGMADKLREATLPLVKQVRSEPNNLLYFLHESREAPGHFIFYESPARQTSKPTTPHPTYRPGSPGCPNSPMAA